jgi:hypothetical protein
VPLFVLAQATPNSGHRNIIPASLWWAHRDAPPPKSSSWHPPHRSDCNRSFLDRRARLELGYPFMRSRNKIFTFFLLYYFPFTQYLYADPTRYHAIMVIGNAIGSMTRQWQHAIASMTQQQHHAMTNVAMAMPSPTWVGCDITPWPTSPWQCHRRHDSAVASCHGRRCVGHVIANMTRQQHLTTINVSSAAPSPVRLSNAITSMTRQWHHATANVTSVAPSLARLNNAITSMTW